MLCRLFIFSAKNDALAVSRAIYDDFNSLLYRNSVIALLFMSGRYYTDFLIFCKV